MIAHTGLDQRDADRRAADRLLVRALRNGGVWTGALAVTSLVSVVAETALPAVLGKAVDAVLRGDDTATWAASAGLLIGIAMITDAVDDFAAGVSIARSTARLRHAVLRHVTAMGAPAVRRLVPGDLASRLVGNAAETGRAGPDVIWAVAGIVPALGGIVALALIDPWLCLTFLVGVPVLVLLMRAFVRDASDAAERYLKVQGELAGRLVDALAGARTIAAARTADAETRRVLAPLRDMHRHGVGMWRALGRINVQEALLLPLLEVAVLAVAGLELIRGRITPGEMLAAAQYVVLGAGLGQAVQSLARLTRSRAAAGRLAAVLNEAPAPAGAERLPPGPGRLEFRAVAVRAGGRQVFDRLDLVVPGGALVAVVGRSGSGKSMLAALAGRLADPDEGEVRLDGVPLVLLDPGELRRAVAYGFERPVLFGDTVADAIGSGAPEATADDVAASARAARADAFVRRLPRGYRTPLTAAPMSGGQAQRVGLARAFLQGRRVLILDDVAASLDTLTEHQITRVLTGPLADRTRIVVAHRASIAARADTVVWLDDGLRAMAPHHLLWNDPDYRAAFGADRADGSPDR
ncbi:ABC transporter ATP-binding protein/permease [Spirillospora sp. NBC_00431]